MSFDYERENKRTVNDTGNFIALYVPIGVSGRPSSFPEELCRGSTWKLSLTLKGLIAIL